MAGESPYLYKVEVGLSVPSYNWIEVFLNRWPGDPNYDKGSKAPGPGVSGGAPAQFDYDLGKFPRPARTDHYAVSVWPDTPDLWRSGELVLFISNRTMCPTCRRTISWHEISLVGEAPAPPPPQPPPPPPAKQKYATGAFRPLEEISPRGYVVEYVPNLSGDIDTIKILRDGTEIYRYGVRGQGSCDVSFTDTDGAVIEDRGIPFSSPYSDQLAVLVHLGLTPMCGKRVGAGKTAYNFWGSWQSPDALLVAIQSQPDQTSSRSELTVLKVANRKTVAYTATCGPDPSPQMEAGNWISYQNDAGTQSQMLAVF